jgi:hypothetical protein
MPADKVTANASGVEIPDYIWKSMSKAQQKSVIDALVVVYDSMAKVSKMMVRIVKEQVDSS